MIPRLPVVLFAVWCTVVLLVFALATTDGYAAFATAGRPTPLRPIVGEHHK